jgi:hypothetical protein
LAPGRSAIVAEIEEDWVTPLDSHMEAAGGIVLRAWRDDIEDERIRREAETAPRRARATADRARPGQGRMEIGAAGARRGGAGKCQDVCDRVQARID